MWDMILPTAWSSNNPDTDHSLCRHRWLMRVKTESGGVDVPITLDGSRSFHLDPFRDIVLYEWDLDGGRHL